PAPRAAGVGRCWRRADDPCPPLVHGESSPCPPPSAAPSVRGGAVRRRARGTAMGNRDEDEQSRTPGAGPRVTALPGPSRLVRISEGAFDRVRALALGEEPAPELTEEQVVELELAGLLVDSPDDEDALVLDQHWEQLLRSGLRSPVGAELVCVDGDRGWATTLRIAGRFVLVIDQEREVSADETTMRLGRRSNAVLLGLATIEHL